jgi:hypothetical protein
LVATTFTGDSGVIRSWRSHPEARSCETVMPTESTPTRAP